jgi:hypothetical protein
MTEVMIAQTEKSTAPQAGSESELLALEALEVSMGWQIIQRILKENIAYLEKTILDKIDPFTKAEVLEEEADKLRYKREVSKEFLDTPGNYMRLLRKSDEPEKKDPDPFYKDVKELAP